MRLRDDNCLLNALLRRPVQRTPVWLMRQAGRYLPEYRALRERAGSFLSLCKTPELACEVTLQPLKRFALDAAIVFSDILVIPDAMGMTLAFNEVEGPTFEPIRSKMDILKLVVPDPEIELKYVMDTIRLLCTELNSNNIPLIGFAGSPWTLAVYMLEGKSSRYFTRVKYLLYEQPLIMHQLLEIITKTIILYLNAQVFAGVQVLMLFDTWGSILAPKAYREFSLSYIAQIIAGLHRQVNHHQIPVVIFARGGGLHLQEIANTNCDAIGLDWTIDLSEARCKVGAQVALQGNLDPAVLAASPERIREYVLQIISAFGKGSGHVFNLGHGIQPWTDPDHVRILVEAVHEFSKAYHN